MSPFITSRTAMLHHVGRYDQQAVTRKVRDECEMLMSVPSHRCSIALVPGKEGRQWFPQSEHVLHPGHHCPTEGCGNRRRSSSIRQVPDNSEGVHTDDAFNRPHKSETSITSIAKYQWTLHGCCERNYRMPEARLGEARAGRKKLRP